MAAHSSVKLIPFRRTLLQVLNPLLSSAEFSNSAQNPLMIRQKSWNAPRLEAPPLARSNLACGRICYRFFASVTEESLGPAVIDYNSLLQEDEFHKLANSTIHDFLEKLEEYGDSVEIDGYDVDYGNEVLTLKLGSLGTYVINKQTPNRQIWMSSPVSGPSRFDWDQSTQAWIYRRTREHLIKVLETELEQLCGQAINLS